jgi:outer membrane autotransporter protein
VVGYGFSGRLETGYRVGLPALAITPYAAIQAQSLHTPGYSETDVSGGGFVWTNTTASLEAPRLHSC